MDTSTPPDHTSVDSSALQGGTLVHNVQTCATVDDEVNRQTSNNTEDKAEHIMTGDECRHPTTRESPTSEQSALVTASYEAFEGEFLAEDFIHRVTRQHRQTRKEIDKDDDDSTFDDVTTIRECENIDVFEDSAHMTKEESAMPKKLPSNVEHRFKNESLFFQHVEKTQRQKSAGGGKRRRYNSAQNPSASSDAEDRAVNQSDDVRAVLNACKKSGMKRYSSTGDLSTAGRMSPATRKRLLPDLATCKRLSRDEESWSSSSENLHIAATPDDRQTLEAQFKLLYRENVNLDRAYGELQEKVRAESPMVLSGRYLSPREAKWQTEKKEFRKEISRLQDEIERMKTIKAQDNSNEIAGSLSPPSEKTELHLKEKLRVLIQVKDAEIARLTDQVSYWMKRTETSTNDINQERIAELEQSEALLRCKVINLEDQLTSSQNQQANLKLQNKDLGDHCKKLEDSLVVIDAEKSLLDDLKKESSNLRNKLAVSENETNQLVDKLAKLAEENALLSAKCSDRGKSDATLQKKLKESNEEVSVLKNECTALSDRCSALEVVKTCLTEQIRSMEDELSNESSEANEKNKKLNQKIRSLQEEMSNLTEYKEKYESEQELNANMTEKLTKRISDLQDHIETLKSQLDNQKHKVTSFDLLQDQLEIAISEKCSLEAKCKSHHADKEKLEAKLSDQQGQLSDSFERANMQLMLETNEMATRQRSLLAELQTLRIKSSVRDVQARIGANLKNRLKSVVDSCVDTLRSIQASQPKAAQRGVSPVPTLALGDLAATPRVPQLDGLEVELDIAQPSDRELEATVVGYVDSIDGLTLDELVGQEESPRADGLGELEGLKRDAGESHVIAETLVCSTKILTHLWSREIENQHKIAELEEEIVKFRDNPHDTSGNIDSLPGITKSEDSHEENVRLHLLVGELEGKENDLSCELRKVQCDLELSKQVEEELKNQLSETQGVCDQLVSRMQKVQEEKAELIMMQQQTSSGAEHAEVNSLRESLQKAQVETSLLREKLQEVKSKSKKELSERVQEIDDLRRKLEEVQKLEADTRRCLDDTQLAGEELIRRVQVIQEEKFNLVEKNKIETNNINEALKSQTEALRCANDKNKRLEEENMNLRNDCENLQKSNENQMEKLLANDAMIADFQHSQEQSEKEITQLYSRIEDMQNDMDCMKTTTANLQETIKEANERADRNESQCVQMQKDWDKSSKEVVLYKNQSEDTKSALESEIERLRLNNDQLQEEISTVHQNDKTKAQSDVDEDTVDKQDYSSLEQALEAKTRQITELQDSLISAETRVESLCEELNNKLAQYAELETELEKTVKKLNEVEKENLSLNRIIEKLRSQSPQAEENALQDQNLQLELDQLRDECNKAQDTILNNEEKLRVIKEENLLLQQEAENQQRNLRPQSAPRDMAIQCSITHDPSADKSSTSDYRSNAFTGEVERTPEQCSKVEGEHNYREKQLSIAAGQENSSNVPRGTSSIAQASDISGSNKTMDNLIDFDSDIGTVDEGQVDSRLVSSASDRPSLPSGGNVSATESNQLLLDPTIEAPVILDSVTESLPGQEADCLERLRSENQRLVAMMRIAQDKAIGRDALQERVREYQAMVNELRAKLNEAESHAQSGTESDPEAILQERRTRQAEDKRQIERLMAQLQDSDCTVIACKNKMQHEENLNTDLRVSNQKLRDELNVVKQKLKLPDHPVIENVLMHLKQERLSKSSPASLAAHQKAAESTPLGSMSEWETAPFDKVLTYLCDDYAEGKEEIERLTTELEDSRDLLNSLKRRNHELEQEALDLEEKLHETSRNLANKEDETTELQKLLTMNEANSKESIRSKEEDIEKLEDKIQSLRFDVDEKAQHLRRVEDKKEAVTLEYDAKFSRMEGKLHSINIELNRQVEEKEELAMDAKKLERENSEVKLLLNEKDEMLKTMRSAMREQEDVLRDSLKSLQHQISEKCESEATLNETLRFRKVEIDDLKQAKTDLEETANKFKATVDLNEQNIASLSSELSDREEKIEVLSSRLGELSETEGALRSTMENADEMIAEREQQHLQEVEQLKDGLNKSMSEARRAEMSSEELHEEILLLETKNETLQKEIEDLRKDENDFATDMETMEMERELMNTSLINAREETQEVRDKNDDLEHTVEDLTETIELMQATIDELNNQVVTLRNECDQLTAEVQQRDMKIAEVMEENNTMNQQLNQRRVLKEDERGSNVDRNLEASKLHRNEGLEEETSILQEELVQAQKLIQTLRIDKENLEQEVMRMQSDSARGSLQWTDISGDNRYDVSDVSLQPSMEETNTEGEDSPVAIVRLQEDSLSLRSENEALRFKIASLEDSLTEMTERPVPKLELGSIAESEPKPRHDDDTGRYVDDCDVDTARIIQETNLTEKLRASENAAAKLLMQVQEMEEETVSLRDRVEELTKHNEDMQSEFFGAIHENFQSQIDELSTTNSSLKGELDSKNKKLEEATAQMQQVSGAENQWRTRYQEVQKMAEELRSQLQRAEEDNHELQCRLIDLDQECQKMMRQGSEQHVETPDGVEMKPKSCDACVQTLSLDDVIRELKKTKKARKQRQLATNGVVDTENEVSDIDSSHSSGSATRLAAELLTIPESQGGGTGADGLANDLLLQRSIIREKLAPDEERFNEADIPAPVTQTEKGEGTTTPDSEPPSISIATKLGASLGDQIKSLQSEIVGYQLMIEKLKKRNQELLDGAGAAMTQDDKEAMEREISALRGQVALLERNNRIFSDQERKDLKQDLDMANKRCMNLQTQLLTLKKRMEYEEIQKLQKECDNFKAEAEKLREQLREYEDQQSRSDSDSDNSNHGEKYARLLELEEEAEDLKAKIKEKEEDLKDRDVMVDELQHQLENVKKQHHEEAKKLEKKNKERETEMMEEVRDLEKQVEDCQEMIELKQYNLKNKCNQLEESEFEIEKLQKEVQKKNKEIEKLKWEIESLQRENASLRERIDNLRQALNDVNSMPTSPITSFRSPNTSMQFRSRSSSRSSTPRTSPQRKSDLTHRSAESFESSTGPVRASSSVDEDSDGKRMRSPLRSGIESAKQKVHDIGDVLDTPRSASTVKSPIHKEPINIWPHVGLHRSTEDIGTDAKPIEPEKEDETSSSSSSSESVSLGNVRPNRLNVSSPMDVQDHTQNAPPSNSPFGQDDSVQDVPGLGDKQKGGKEKSIDKFDENLRLGTGVQEPDVVALKSDSLTELHNTDPMREDLVSVISVPSNNATLEATDPIGPSRSSTIGEGLIPEEAVSPNGLLKTKDEDQKRGTNMSSSSTSSLSSVRQPSSPLDSQRPREARAETVQTDQSSQNFKDSERRGKEKKKRGKESPHDSKQNDTDIFEARDRAVANQHSLLPDDRPTLVQEVTKAREEARKWFQEVTQSDREKRNMSRRLAELESELDRLQDIEDNYATLKKKQKEVDKVTRDLETLRAQTAAANRKAEEARERSALLQAHLLDKEEVEAENAKLKENIEVLKHENKERKPSSPLRELQLPSANTSASELASTPRKSKSVEASPSIVELSPADKDQLRSIKDSFEYVAGNFTSLVLKKHDAELTLAPEKAKVSQLKRKCLERDQLLAKLVLKLRKKKHDVSDDVSESHDDISVASSVGLDQMLAKADSLIRTNVVDSDWSDADSLIATTSKDEKGKSNEFISPPRPSSALIRSLTEKSSKSPPSPPTHRIFVAKRDYAPSARSDDDPTAPVTHSLLPDLPVLAGDTVVAIGNPDKRGDGKLYQLAEVRGKIGFVPLAHLVAAEQVEGMQAFVQEKSKKKKSPCSSPEKIVDLYRKLEQAHLLVADKIDRVSRSSKSTAGSNSFDSSARDINQPPLSSTKPYSSSTAKYQENRGEDRRAATIDDDGCRSATSYSPSFMGEWPRKPKSRSSEKGAEGEEPPSKRHLERSRRSSGRSSRRSISPVLPISRDLDIDVRSSTPLLLPEKQSRRSSSLPPRRDEHSSLKRRSKRDKNASTERTLAPPRVLSSPRSPTFVVIEKTMGQKSMIISWTPPVLDMISRSNGIPVIGYEISIDGERRVQISGAYSNKAILGDLDLTRNFLVEVKTVSSVGTLSRPAEVMYSPNADFSAQSELAGSFNQTGTDVMQSTSTPQQSNKSASENLFGSPIRRATALYDYDPAVDSPYKSHDEEIGLNKGSPVLVLGSPRPDGFCDVQVGKKRGIAPIAFLVSEDDDTDTSSMTSSARQKPRSSRPRTKSKRQL